MASSTLSNLGPFDVPHLVRRTVRVCVPPGGVRPGGPVLFLFDGQNLFDDAPSFAGGWHLHQTLARIGRRRAPLIVGIDHGGTERIDELTPWSSARGGGKLDRLLDWMVGDLVPRIQGEFGVATDPKHVGIGGSSLGGLAAMYAHHRHPEKFGAALCMSPSFWFASGRIFEFVEGQSKPWTTRVYIDAGRKEGGAADQAQRMADLLTQRGYADVLLRLDPRGTHNESCWRRRAPSAIRFLFPPHHGEQPRARASSRPGPRRSERPPRASR